MKDTELKLTQKELEKLILLIDSISRATKVLYDKLLNHHPNLKN